MTTIIITPDMIVSDRQASYNKRKKHAGILYLDKINVGNKYAFGLTGVGEHLDRPIPDIGESLSTIYSLVKYVRGNWMKELGPYNSEDIINVISCLTFKMIDSCIEVDRPHSGKFIFMGGNCVFVASIVRCSCQPASLEDSIDNLNRTKRPWGHTLLKRDTASIKYYNKGLRNLSLFGEDTYDALVFGSGYPYARSAMLINGLDPIDAVKFAMLRDPASSTPNIEPDVVLRKDLNIVKELPLDKLKKRLETLVEEEKTCSL